MTRESYTAPQGSFRTPYDHKHSYDAVGNGTKMDYWEGSTTYTTTYAYSLGHEAIDVCQNWGHEWEQSQSYQIAQVAHYYEQYDPYD